MPIDHVLRGVLAAALLAAVLMSGPVGVKLWPDRGWSLHIVMTGMFGLLVYLFAGQIKAYAIGVDFDWVSGLGLVFALLTDVGLACTLWLPAVFRWIQRRHERK